jgi:hypothetical protein
VNKRDLVSSSGSNGFEFLVATTNMCNLPFFFFWKVLFFDYESQMVCVLGGMRVPVIMNLVNLGPN